MKNFIWSRHTVPPSLLRDMNHHDHDHPLSAQDIMTDLNAESELLPLQPVREEWKGHKVSLFLR